MLRRTFMSIFGMIPFVPKPACSDGPRSAKRKENGCWEAPGFYGTFICMTCGGQQGCNNVKNCSCTKMVPGEKFEIKKCGDNHWAIGSIHINDEFVLYHKPPNQNCIMARRMTIAVPDGDFLIFYERDEENKGRPKITGRMSIRQMLISTRQI